MSKKRKVNKKVKQINDLITKWFIDSDSENNTVKPLPRNKGFYVKKDDVAKKDNIEL